MKLIDAVKTYLRTCDQPLDIKHGNICSYNPMTDGSYQEFVRADMCLMYEHKLVYKLLKWVIKKYNRWVNT